VDPEDAELEIAGDHWWNKDSADTGSSNTKSWAELDISDRTGFEPRVIRGGLSEN
jgi:hypothetical protein